MLELGSPLVRRVLQCARLSLGFQEQLALTSTMFLFRVRMGTLLTGLALFADGVFPQFLQLIYL